MKEAASTEFVPDTPYPVISLLSEQRGIKDMGGTMRLKYRCDPCRARKHTRHTAATPFMSGTGTGMSLTMNTRMRCEGRQMIVSGTHPGRP